MDPIRTFFSNLFARLFTVTIAHALADLEKAEAKLRKAITTHADQADIHLFAIAQHEAAFRAQTDAAQRAERVANKLADLTA
jgi:hypothetical protein